MPRSAKAERIRIAEKAIREAMSEETIGLQSDLAAANRQIERLCGVLETIAKQATAAAGVAPSPAPAPIPAPPVRPFTPEPPAEPGAPSTDLSDEDNLGEGRWA